MNNSSNFNEEDLIAFHLNELPRARANDLRRALESDAQLATESEEIAATLRAFRDAPTPHIDAAMMERSWSNVRSSLAVLPKRPRRRFFVWGTALAGSLVAVVVAVTLLFTTHRASLTEQASASAAHSPLLTPVSTALDRIRGKHSSAPLVNNRPGPLTTAPVDAIADDPAMGAYLDSAERLLTEVSHEQGTPSDETRTRVHSMLLQNAVYQRTAQDRGDLAAADVMDDLGRVLVSLDAAPPTGDRNPDAFRLQMSVGSVLFDLRILHSKPASATQKTAE
jgi:hypothetical protein